MREDTITTKVYKFDELSDTAKEKVIEELWDCNIDYEWWDSTYEDAKTIGLEITSFDLNRGACVEGEWNIDAEDVANVIQDNHGESCETYKDAEVFLLAVGEAAMVFEAKDDYDPEYEEYTESDEYEELCAEFLKTILEDYRIILQKESEYLQSEEAAIETIEANEWEFTVDGIMY